MLSPYFDASHATTEGIQPNEVLKMLKAEGKINDAVIENILSWHHSGFNVYCGPTIRPNNDQGLEDLARYIIRACFHKSA